jgi:deazaflavin-dependent oxidoreductase (nitroreductase family)
VSNGGVRNPLSLLARALGTRPWVMRMAGGILWADRWLHRVFGGQVSLVRIAGLPSLRLTSTGRKSGLPRSNNLLYFPDGDELVLTGSNWGKPNNPSWTYNLRAHPDVTVAIRGRDIPVHAHEVKGEEYDELWGRLLGFWPGYEMERTAAGRDLPLFVLTPR